MHYSFVIEIVQNFLSVKAVEYALPQSSVVSVSNRAKTEIRLSCFPTSPAATAQSAPDMAVCHYLDEAPVAKCVNFSHFRVYF